MGSDGRRADGDVVEPLTIQVAEPGGAEAAVRPARIPVTRRQESRLRSAAAGPDRDRELASEQRDRRGRQQVGQLVAVHVAHSEQLRTEGLFAVGGAPGAEQGPRGSGERPHFGEEDPGVLSAGQEGARLLQDLGRLNVEERARNGKVGRAVTIQVPDPRDRHTEPTGALLGSQHPKLAPVRTREQHGVAGTILTGRLALGLAAARGHGAGDEVWSPVAVHVARRRDRDPEAITGLESLHLEQQTAARARADLHATRVSARAVVQRNPDRELVAVVPIDVTERGQGRSTCGAEPRDLHAVLRRQPHLVELLTRRERYGAHARAPLLRRAAHQEVVDAVAVEVARTREGRPVVIPPGRAVDPAQRAPVRARHDPHAAAPPRPPPRRPGRPPRGRGSRRRRRLPGR